MRFGLILVVLAAPVWADTQDNGAKRLFRQTYSQTCGGSVPAPNTWFAAPLRVDFAAPDANGRTRRMVLWMFSCSGAPGMTEAHLVLWDGRDHQSVALVVPDLEPGGKRPKVLGWSLVQRAFNPRFDADTLTLTTHRADGSRDEAFEAARYRLVDGHFRLVQYQVDRIYDGKQRPVTIYAAP